MQFAVIALFVCIASVMGSDPDPITQARTMMANRILTADPATFTDCRDGGDSACEAKPSWKCQPLMKMCAPGNAPEMNAIEGTCETTSDCRPLFRCNGDKKCAFVGPRACATETDCNVNVSGVSFSCVELPKNAPGKRCWMKCSTDNECHGCNADGTGCRVPENFRKHIGCCQGTCQRKSACTA